MDAKNVFNSIIGNIKNMDDRIDSWNSYHDNIKRYFKLISTEEEVETSVHLAKHLKEAGSCNNYKVIWNGVENYKCFVKYVENSERIQNQHRLIHAFFWIKLRELYKKFKDRIFNRIENEESLQIFDEAADETIDFLKKKIMKYLIIIK